jgi:hypothetical protein
MSYLYSVALRHVCAKHVGVETDLDIENGNHSFQTYCLYYVLTP